MKIELINNFLKEFGVLDPSLSEGLAARKKFANNGNGPNKEIVDFALKELLELTLENITEEEALAVIDAVTLTANHLEQWRNNGPEPESDRSKNAQLIMHNCRLMLEAYFKVNVFALDARRLSPRQASTVAQFLHYYAKTSRHEFGPYPLTVDQRITLAEKAKEIVKMPDEFAFLPHGYSDWLPTITLVLFYNLLQAKRFNDAEEEILNNLPPLLDNEFQNKQAYKGAIDLYKAWHKTVSEQEPQNRSLQQRLLDKLKANISSLYELGRQSPNELQHNVQQAYMEGLWYLGKYNQEDAKTAISLALQVIFTDPNKVRDIKPMHYKSAIQVLLTAAGQLVPTDLARANYYFEKVVSFLKDKNPGDYHGLDKLFYETISLMLNKGSETYFIDGLERSINHVKPLFGYDQRAVRVSEIEALFQCRREDLGKPDESAYSF